MDTIEIKIAELRAAIANRADQTDGFSKETGSTFDSLIDAGSALDLVARHVGEATKFSAAGM